MRAVRAHFAGGTRDLSTLTASDTVRYRLFFMLPFAAGMLVLEESRKRWLRRRTR